MNTKLNINAIDDGSITRDKVTNDFFSGEHLDMTVGHADSATDLTGHNESSEQSFIFQPSAGDMSIKDESAYIKKIKGNSVVWNQLLNVANAVALTPASASVKVVGNSITVTSNVSASAGDNVSVKIPNVVVPVGHKVLLTYEMTTKALGITTCHTEGVVESYSSPSFKDITKTSTNLFLKADGVVEVGDSWVFSNIHLFDLTKMFGAGNEPTTVEYFYARIPSGIDVNAYNEGEIINLNTKAIKTIGFNQWDEQWIAGYLDYRDGVLIPSESNGAIASLYHIPVLPDTDYYFRPVTMPRLVFYDKDKNFIKGIVSGSNGVQHTPANCHYIRFSTSSSYGSVYKNDICINLSHTGWKNGTYEPYREFTRELPIIKKYFPDGMKKAGSAFDSIEWDSNKQKWVAVRRIGTVDLGSLSGAYVSENGHYQINISDKKTAMSIGNASNLTCSKYPTTPVTYASNTSKPLYSVMESISESRTLIYVVDPTCTDASSYVSTLNGVMLNYELAEPIVTEIDEEYVNFDYYVEDFGTEEAISSIASAPFNADIVYQFNAVDRIRDNDRKIDAVSENYVKRKSDKEISIITHGYYAEYENMDISSGLSMIPASESKLYTMYDSVVSELQTRINKTNNIPEIRLHTEGRIPDNNTIDGYIMDANSTLIFDPISLKIDGRTIAPIGDLKSNGYYGNVIYMDKPHIIYSDTNTNDICLLRFNELSATNKTIYGYPYTLIFNHTNGDDGLFGIDTAIEYDFDEYIYNYGSCEIKWTDKQISKVDDGIIDPSISLDFEHIYIIPGHDDSGNPYSYSEVQIVKYGENLPWFGVVAHYY